MDLHSLARQWFLGARRIELQKLAIELGISRATAYRWAGSAEQLVAEVLASLVDETFADIAGKTQSVGCDRVLEVLEKGMRFTHGFQPLKKFLQNNPYQGLKTLTTRQGPVQGRIIAHLEQLLNAEVDAGYMRLVVAPGVMAFALTRIVESFLYADLITGDEPDIDNAVKILQLMLRQDDAGKVAGN
ncbi:MAG: AcrR family transcriptional regulator [Candidatus Pseudothioglobus sp.]|jgi:AcrR family transcriptional regulator